jgi:hypothetical protein
MTTFDIYKNSSYDSSNWIGECVLYRGDTAEECVQSG